MAYQLPDESYFANFLPEVAASLRRNLVAYGGGFLLGSNPAYGIDQYVPYRTLEGDLRDNNHSAWGFVIYRCTYDSDERWDQMMDMLQSRPTAMSVLGKPFVPQPLTNSLKYTVHEDKDSLDGADAAVVQQHFREWLATNPEQQEQPAESIGKGNSPRYRYCMMIDEASMSSIFDKPSNRAGRMRFINNPDCGYAILVSARSEGLKDEESYWMKVDFEDLMTGWYELLVGDRWHAEYKPPPRIAIA